MTNTQLVIFSGIIIVFGFLLAMFIFYWTDYIECHRITNFIEHCKTPVQNELADGLYRYQCDAGYYTSSLSPEKFQELKANK